MEDALFLVFLVIFLWTAIRLMDDGDDGGRKARIPA